MGSAFEPGSADGRAGAVPEDDDWLTGAVRPSVFRSVFQVLSADGAVAGAGFLVDDGIGFTCAHVVRAAGVSPGGRGEVVFPRLPGAPRMAAEVAADGWRAPEGDDVAVLRFATLPTEAQGMAVGVSVGSRGHRVSSFGFPAQAPWGGHFGYGEAGGRLPAGNGAVRLLQLAGANDLTTGFSGAPVVDEVTGLVIGMVTSIASPDAHLKGLGIAYATPAEVLRAVLPRLAEQQACPYLGLEPFDTRHARWFHGRVRARERVLAALDGNRRLVMLLGPSGAGKSSLVNAGVLPALAGGAVSGSDRWLPVCTRPGHDLLRQLEDAGLPGAATDGLTAAVQVLLGADTSHDRVLLVIDQFEELLTQRASASGPMDRSGGDVRLDAVEQLVRLIDSHAPITVLLIMRNDFYASLDAFAPTLLSAATPGLCNIPAALSRTELLEIITGPAADVGVPLESGLAERIVNDIAGVAPMARQAPVTLLPALELTLLQLWRRRRGEDGSLTHAAYEKIGEVTGSLSAWCNSALGQLPVWQRHMARRILTALVRPADEDNGIPAIRRIVPLLRLRALSTVPALEGPATDADFDTVLAALTRHRIVTTGTAAPGALSGEPAAELIHDALIRDWAELRDWVVQDHRFQVWLLRVTEQQARHAYSGRADDLLQGSLLAEGEEWAGQHPLPAEITEFLAAGRRREQAALRRTRRFNTVLAVLLALALLATGIALDQRHSATATRQAAVAARHAAQSRELAARSAALTQEAPDLAALLAVHAYRTSPTAEAIDSLYRAEPPAQKRLTGHRAEVWSVSFSPDSRTLATGSVDGAVRLWDAATGREQRRFTDHVSAVIGVVVFSPDGKSLAIGDESGVWIRNAETGALRRFLGAESLMTAAFSPDGRTLAAGDAAGNVRLWDVVSGRSLHRLTGHTDVVNSLTFSPDSHTLATASHDGTVRLWDISSGRTSRTLDADKVGVLAVRFSPDGQTLATAGGERFVRLWNAASGRLRETYVETGPVRSLAFSSDGRALAAGGYTFVRLRDLSDGRTRDLFFTGIDESVSSMAFRPDGRMLATGGDGGTVRLWDVATGRTDDILPVQPGGVLSVALSPDGRTLVSGNGRKETVRTWNLARGRGSSLTPDSARLGGVAAVAFHRDGRTLATGAHDGTVRVWDTDARRIRLTLTGHTDFVRSAVFSPDGRTLVTSSNDKTIRLWNVADGKHLRTLTGHKKGAMSVAFSPNGRTLATASADQTIRLWDPDTGKLKAELTGHTSPVWSVAYSPDGRTLASADNGGTVRLWDPASSTTKATLVGAPQGMLTVAFSPDGRTLAAAGGGGSVRLWDARTGMPLGALHGHTEDVWSVVFSPDGRTLATGSTDETVRLWNLDPHSPSEAMNRVCRTVDQDLTKRERAVYLPDGPPGPACPA